MTGAARPLAAFPVFAQLPEAELELISSTAQTVRFAANERLFSEGRPADGCWLIHDGRVALDLTVPGRGQVVLQTLGPGDVLGWSWLVPPYRWHFRGDECAADDGDGAGHRRSCALSPSRTRGLDTRWCDLVRRGPAAPASHPGPAP